MKKIIIFRDRLPHRPLTYAIDHYALRWRKAGYQVEDHIGLGKMPDADLVFVHIDLTIIPNEYIEYIKKIPNALNGRIFDISRRSFSKLILSRDDNYSGKVIVKTNANFGGLPEHFLNRKWYSFCLKKWSKVQHLSKYSIFDSIEKVPAGVWENMDLVVEPYIQPNEDYYSVSYYMFFGDKYYSGRLKSNKPLVKFDNSFEDELIPLPDEVKNWRDKLKIDFGRLDYVESEGKYYLIDVNKTEGGGNLNLRYPKETDLFAAGIDHYLATAET